MTAVEILPAGADRDTWLAARRRYLGSSDIAAVMGVSTYDGPLAIWMSKIHNRSKPVNDAMSIGTHMEPWIIARYADAHPDHTVTHAPGMYAADDDFDDAGYRWRAANPDGIARANGRHILLEAKTAHRYGDDTGEVWGDEDTDEIPYAYLCQVTWTCAVLGCNRWVVPVVFDGCDYREYRGDLDPSLADTLISRGRAWWNRHIVAGAEPPADRLESTRTILVDRYRAAEQKKTFTDVCDPQALIWQAEYCQLRTRITELKQAQAERANLLRQAHVQADAAELRHAGQTISTMTTTRTGTVRLNVKEYAS